VEGDGQLDHAERSAEVTPTAGHDLEHPLPHLLGELRKLLAGEGFEIAGIGNPVEEPAHSGVK
jgi:hypothetical protein